MRGRVIYDAAIETRTFLFTDIEGSTALLRRLGDDAYAALLAEHHRVIRAALAAHEGHEDELKATRSLSPSTQQVRA